MAITLLQAVNKLLTRVREVDSRGELTSLTDSARQTKIDNAVQAWNDATRLLFELTHQPIPMSARDADIVLETGKRLYPLATDLVHLHWPLRHKDTPTQEAQGWRIWPYARDLPDGGYMQLISDDLFPDASKGRPERAAITPDRRELYVDRTPTEEEDGDVYVYTYSKRFNLAAAGDTFPFPDASVEALVPAVAELWRGDYQNALNQGVFQTFMANAARMMRPNPLRKHW